MSSPRNRFVFRYFTITKFPTHVWFLFSSTVDDGLCNEIRSGYGQIAKKRFGSTRHERFEFQHHPLRQREKSVRMG